MSTSGATQETADLSNQEILRYSRHLIIPEVGMSGQRRIKTARVLIVGAGGLGSPTALYLAAAGVGTLGLVDYDVVELTNLQRQVLHSTPAVGTSKIESATRRLSDLNPHVLVEAYETQLTSRNALEIIARYDLVVDGTDNFATRYLVNDACVLLGRPNVYGSIYRFDGQASVFCTPDGPCYRCLYPKPPPPGLVPSCAEGGVLGVLPGLVGTIQATEALKLILGSPGTLIGRLLLVDALGMEFRTVRVRRDPGCPACGTREMTELVDYEQLCGTATSPQDSDDENEVTPRDLMARLAAGDDVDLVDVREPHEWEICRLPGARLVPLSRIPDALSSFDSARDIVLYCKMGSRGVKGALVLREAGFKRVWNLAGGITRWSEDVDPDVPKY